MNSEEWEIYNEFRKRKEYEFQRNVRWQTSIKK